MIKTCILIKESKSKYGSPGLMVIKLSSTIFILVFQYCPIRTKYLFNAVFWLAVFKVKVQTHAQKVFFTLNARSVSQSNTFKLTKKLHKAKDSTKYCFPGKQEYITYIQRLTFPGHCCRWNFLSSSLAYYCYLQYHKNNVKIENLDRLLWFNRTWNLHESNHTNLVALVIF